jgi:hypothetical protein
LLRHYQQKTALNFHVFSIRHKFSGSGNFIGSASEVYSGSLSSEISVSLLMSTVFTKASLINLPNTVSK